MPARIILFVAPINILLSYLLGELSLGRDRIVELDAVFQYGDLTRFALDLSGRQSRLPSHII